MSNLNMITPLTVQGIINKFCYTIGMLPTSYKQSLTYEEQLLAIGHYLETTVYPAINNNAQALAELQTLFAALQDYVNNYFDNLDVTEEINAKLDDMAESGELEEIIATYLETKAIFGFNNITEMINAENLTNGSIVQTLGYYDPNDGGGGLYKIRNVEVGDIEDSGLIIPINTELIAELIIKNRTINIKQYGVKGDGIIDETTKIKTAIANIPDGSTLFFPKGEYLITEKIVLPNETTKIIKIVGADRNLTKFKFNLTSTTEDCAIQITGNSSQILNKCTVGFGFISLIILKLGVPFVKFS